MVENFNFILLNYIKMKNTKSVYLLIDQWTETFWNETNVTVFDTIEKAKAKLEEKRKDFLEHESKDYIDFENDVNKRRQKDELVLDMRLDEKEIL